MKDSWTIETERMTVTVVSEPHPAFAGATPETQKKMGGQIPSMPAYIMLKRKGGVEPIRIEGEDAELLVWLLSKLPMGRPRGPFQLLPPGGGDIMGTIG